MTDKVQSFIKNNYSEYLLDRKVENHNIPHFSVKPEGLVKLVQGLKETPGLEFVFLNDLTAVDWLEKRSPRFEVLYLLRSPKNNHFRIQLRVPIDEGETVPSLTSVFKGANWPEREVYDLFGIAFSDHPFMERIVLPDNFVGHPLRKDYPLEGPGQDYLIQDLLQIHVNEDIVRND